MLASLNVEECLTTIELITYAVSQVKFTEEIAPFLEQKTRLVFASEQTNPMRQTVNSLSSWFHETLLSTNEKLTRKFLYLSVCLLEQWLGSDPEFQSILARLAGSESPAPEIQSQLVHCFLSTYLISQANTMMLNMEKAQSDKQFKNSLLRLSRHTKILQQVLNEMFSL